MPGTDWFLAFKKRHALSLKQPQSVEYARKKATDPFIIYGYFKLLKETLDQLRLNGKPSQIWNLDESSFSIDPSKTKVVGKRGLPCSRVTSTPGRENTTVSMLASGSGEKGPPLIIFKGANVWDQWQAPDDIFPGLSYAASKKGWMDAEIFFNYFKNTVIPALGEQRPVLIIYDGHSTHVTTRVIELARQENITILKLPPHTTHLLQPLDLAVFKSVKNIWEQKLVKWQRHNIGRKLPKKMFSTFIAETWKETQANVIISGFRKAGIVPFDDKVVAREKFDTEALKRWNSQNATNGVTAENNNEPEIHLPNTSNEVTCVHATNIHQDMPGTSTQSADIAPSNGAPSFEKLLLECVRQHQATPKISKRKVAPGAQVITAPKNQEAEIPKNQKKARQKAILNVSDSSSESNDELIPYQDSDNDEEFLQEMHNLEETNECQTIEIGKWVLVQYATKKSLKHFVGKVIQKGDCDEWLIRFLRFKKSKFVWPNVHDEDLVDSANILKILPQPTEDRRGSGLIFFVKFDGYNII